MQCIIVAEEIQVSRACFHCNDVLETAGFLRQKHEDSHSLKEEIKIELNNKVITVAGILTFLCTPKRENTLFANPLQTAGHKSTLDGQQGSK